MPERSTLGLKVINRSRVIERIYGRLDSLRSLGVLAFASETTLDGFNAAAYGAAERYDPESEAYVSSLYPWEELAIEQHFPPPPARILVGGAGAGREPFALAERGYEVVAFEPVARLTEAMAKRAARTGAAVTTYRGGYRDLPRLESVGGSHAETLVPGFDAVVIGWGSISHLYTERDRLGALESMAALTDGPILVSFIATRPEGPLRTSRLRKWLVSRRGRHPADRFSISMGFHHPMNEKEVRELAAKAELEVNALDFSGRTLAPHAVLASRRKIP
ncbi:MAG TPA: class I SAM-dependent methyltransferase [Acidimicrobiia bacterium]